MEILTGQVSAEQPPTCDFHRETLHGLDMSTVWCNRCGWHVPADGTPSKRGRANGGWGGPAPH